MDNIGYHDGDGFGWPQPFRQGRLAYVDEDRLLADYRMRQMALRLPGGGPPVPRTPAPVYLSARNREPTEQSRSYITQMHERMLMILYRGIESDVSFLVGTGKELVRAHKLYLAKGSEIFQRMFYSEMNSESLIKLPDCNLTAFKHFLEFMYIENVKLPYNTEMVANILYIARKYFVETLVKECSEFMERNLGVNSVLGTLRLADFYSLPGLEDKCWSFIDEKASPVLHKYFAKLSLELLCKILERDTLKIPELEVFQAVHGWAKIQLDSKDMAPSPENFKEVAGPAIQLIRFPLLHAHEIANIVVRTKMLSTQEIADLYTYVSTTEIAERPEIEFDATPRAGSIEDIPIPNPLQAQQRYYDNGHYFMPDHPLYRQGDSWE